MNIENYVDDNNTVWFNAVDCMSVLGYVIKKGEVKPYILYQGFGKDITPVQKITIRGEEVIWWSRVSLERVKHTLLNNGRLKSRMKCWRLLEKFLNDSVADSVLCDTAGVSTVLSKIGTSFCDADSIQKGLASPVDDQFTSTAEDKSITSGDFKAVDYVPTRSASESLRVIIAQSSSFKDFKRKYDKITNEILSVDSWKLFYYRYTDLHDFTSYEEMRELVGTDCSGARTYKLKGKSKDVNYTLEFVKTVKHMWFWSKELVMTMDTTKPEEVRADMLNDGWMLKSETCG